MALACGALLCTVAFLVTSTAAASALSADEKIIVAAKSKLIVFFCIQNLLQWIAKLFLGTITIIVR